MSDPFLIQTSAAAIEAMAQQSLDALPAQFRDHLRDVVLKVEEFATREQLDSVEIDDPWDLTGLYEGRPIDLQSQWDSGDMPPVITLFRQPLLREWHETGVDFADLIHHVTVHEAGHHFGLSDDDMHTLEDSVPDS